MLAALVTSLCVFFTLPEQEITQIVALIGAFGDIAIYMLSEAMVDSANSTQTISTTTVSTNTEETKAYNTQIQKNLTNN